MSSPAGPDEAVWEDANHVHLVASRQDRAGHRRGLGARCRHRCRVASLGRAPGAAGPRRRPRAASCHRHRCRRNRADGRRHRCGALRAAVRDTVARFGQLDVVWANAGIASFGPLAAIDEAAWLRTIEVNLIGTFHTLRAALPEVTRQRGHVAVTASLAAFVNGPCLSAYCATKSGVEALCNSLRVELAHHQVTVGCIDRRGWPRRWSPTPTSSPAFGGCARRCPHPCGATCRWKKPRGALRAASPSARARVPAALRALLALAAHTASQHIGRARHAPCDAGGRSGVATRRGQSRAGATSGPRAG